MKNFIVHEKLYESSVLKNILNYEELFLWSVGFIKIWQLDKIFNIVNFNWLEIGNFFVILIGHKLITWVEDKYQTRKIFVRSSVSQKRGKIADQTSPLRIDSWVKKEVFRLFDTR